MAAAAMWGWSGSQTLCWVRFSRWMASAGPGAGGCGDLHGGLHSEASASMSPWMYACLAQASALLCSQAAVMPCREAKQEFTAAADAHRAQQQKVDNALHQVILSFSQLCPWRQQPKAASIEVVLGVTVCCCRG